MEDFGTHTELNPSYLMHLVREKITAMTTLQPVAMLMVEHRL
jgi:hypothetical protein